MALNKIDLDDLMIAFRRAQDSIHAVKYRNPEQGDYFPIYPKEITDFIEYLTNSPWVNRECDLENASDVLSHIASAQIDDIRDCFSAIIISERFAERSWLGYFENGKFEMLVNRAGEIVN